MPELTLPALREQIARTADDHVFLPEGMGDTPVERFMEMVEAILVENDLL
jgi:hypothetical protein